MNTVLLDFTREVVHEFSLDVQGGGVRGVAVLAFVNGELGVGELRFREGQGHGALEVLNRGDLFEDVGQSGGYGHTVIAGINGCLHAVLPAPVADEPVKALGLECKQIRHVKRLVNLCE